MKPLLSKHLFYPPRQILKLLLHIGLLTFLISCSNEQAKLLEQQITRADSRLKILKTALDNNELRNSTILREYSDILAKQRPELRSLANNLKMEATSKGQQFKVLKNQLDEVKSLNAQYGNPKQLLPEAENVIRGADIEVFNDSLIDPVNVLADMSEGKLARIGVMSAKEEKRVNDVKDFGKGSQLVGNPAYGRWNQSHGTSAWEWFGMYAMFSTLTGGNRIFYNSWDRHRPYSYYQDYGMDRYGSYNNRSNYGSSYQKSSNPGSSSPRKRKSYSGDRKSSSYSKGSGVSQRSSSYSRKSSSYSGNLRNSSYSTRGVRGGK